MAWTCRSELAHGGLASSGRSPRSLVQLAKSEPAPRSRHSNWAVERARYTSREPSCAVPANIQARGNGVMSANYLFKPTPLRGAP